MPRQSFVQQSGQLLFSPNGRINRSRYLFSSLLLWTVFWICLLAAETLVNPANTWPLSAVAIYSSICLLVKRLHDRDKSGIWVLLLVIPVIGPIWLLVESFLLKGSESDNRFGAHPITSRYDYLTVE